MSARATPARVAVALGSNLGRREAQLRFAARGLRRLLDRMRASGVYETAPVHLENQPAFLNACCVGTTRLTPRQLLAELQHLERLAGRRKAGRERFGPRELDLDLLLYGDRILDTPDLIVPHPRLRERAFVLVPLAEIAPDFEVPTGTTTGGVTVGELAAALPAASVLRTSIQLEER